MYHILVVDDEKLMRTYLADNIPRFTDRFQVSGVAGDGLEAIELLRRQHFDVVITDIKMPEMNGIDALKEIRKFDQDIPIIMQSAYAFENDMEAARQAGSNGFVTKPINIKELKSVLSSFLPQLTW